MSKYPGKRPITAISGRCSATSLLPMEILAHWGMDLPGPPPREKTQTLPVNSLDSFQQVMI